MYPGEERILRIRYLYFEYKEKPWTYDQDYIDADLYGYWFPEDINTIVQIDSAILEHSRNKK